MSYAIIKNNKCVNSFECELITNEEEKLLMKKLYEDVFNVTIDDIVEFAEGFMVGDLYENGIWTELRDNIPIDVLAKARNSLIDYSKSLLYEHLKTHPYEYIDGKKYSVTLEKQLLLSNVISIYTMSQDTSTPLTYTSWNAVGEESMEWNISDLKDLAVKISNYIVPFVEYQRMKETEIKSTTTTLEIETIQINYEEVIML